MASLTDHGLWTALSASISERFGLHFPEAKWPDLERAVKSVALELGYPDHAQCIRRLLSPVLSPAERETLLRFLTVGETYFFRDERLFETLEQQVLPGILAARRQGTKRIRIWSAGCCTGEEPYSLAILLHRMVPDIRGWDVGILGTDINPVFLRKAADGLFGQWSFRRAPGWLIERYFRKAAGQGFRIIPEIREMVRFAPLNLAADDYPATGSGTSGMDVIFCRNVLMYFTPETVDSVVRRFHRCLSDGGWLVTGPCESSETLHSAFGLVNFGASILYRKGAPVPPEGNGTALPSAGQAVLPEWLPAPAPPAEQGPHREEPDDAEKNEAPREEQPHAATPLEIARACADQGRLQEARTWCEQAIALDRLNPAGHYLLAQILQEEGRIDDAIAAFRTTIYLDQDHLLAHFALGLLLPGKNGEARRHLNTARMLLANYSRDHLFDEAEGMTAGRLLQLVGAVTGKR